METILPDSRVVGAVVWGVERHVKRALARVTIPRECPIGRLCVPRSIQPAVLHWSHASRLVAHPGSRGTLATIRQRFWWPALVRGGCRFVFSCPVCEQSKSSNYPPAGLIRPLPIPSPRSHIALNFITGLPP